LAEVDGRENWHQVPASRSWYLGDVFGPVTKTFLKFWTSFCVVSTFVATTILWLTDWWQIFFTRLAVFFYVQHYYIGWPATFIIGGVIYFWWWRRSKKIMREKKTKEQAARVQRIIDEAYADAGGERKK
jgi:hypothetical protein